LHYIIHDYVDLSIRLHYISSMKTTALQVRVTPTEKQAFDQAAKLVGISFSAWARMNLRRAALREFQDAGQRVDFNPAAERLGNGHN
jgi:uncharacterized protein (DUF1778 family)